MTRLRVGIWGVYGRGNFGNEAALTALLDHLDRDVFEPVLLTEEPEISSGMHGVSAMRVSPPAGLAGSGRIRTALNRLRYFLRAHATVRRLDSVIIAGSGGLERYGSGSFGTPFEVWCLALACRVRRRPFLLLDIGVEVLPRRLARFFVRRAARMATYRTYRDDASRDSMVRTGLPAAAGDRVVTDMVFALQPTTSDHRAARAVAIGVMDYWGRDREQDAVATHDSYTARTAAVARRLQEHGIDVSLIGGDDEDIVFARGLVAEHGLHDVAVLDARTFEELTTELSAVSAVVAARYHTLIMALLVSTPTISVGYGRKHSAMLEQLELELPHRDIEDFAPDDICALVEQAIGAQPELGEGIGAAVAAARHRLDGQWDELHRELTSTRSAGR